MTGTYKKVSKHGNSLALVIPAPICHAYDIREGTIMHFGGDEGGKLVITPRAPTCRYKLSELLAQCAVHGDAE